MEADVQSFKPIKTWDNHYHDNGIPLYEGRKAAEAKTLYEILAKVANKSLSDLQNQHEGLLVFPDQPSESLKEKSLFTLSGHGSDAIFNTYNLMGVYRISDANLGNVTVEIRSRFDSEDRQPFTTYLLSKIFGGNFLSWSVDFGQGMWQMLLIFLFRYYLIRAVQQGLYKEYRQFQYNDAKFRGAINIPAHIRRNIPFQGNVAYQTREFTHDNPVMHLIRHVLSYIKGRYPTLFTALNDVTFYRATRAVTEATPSWNIRQRNTWTKLVHMPIVHPFYTEYEPLRKLCLQILREEGASLYQQERTNKIEGVIFDGAWLWENYLAYILKPISFDQCVHKTDKNVKVFYNDDYALYPDFLHKSNQMVLDAKYKHESRNREDIHQVLSYMYLTEAKYGGLIFPDERDNEYMEEEKQIYNKDRYWLNIKFPIPQNTIADSEFEMKMEQAEFSLRKKVDARII